MANVSLSHIGHRDPEHSGSDRPARCYPGQGRYGGAGRSGERG